MRKFLSVLMSLALMVALVPRFAFADGESVAKNNAGNCSVRAGCSCGCNCTSDENGSFLCELSKDCSCLKNENKGLFYYVTLPLSKVWSFLSNDFAAMGKALGQFTWYQNIFNAVALLFVGALMFRN